MSDAQAGTAAGMSGTSAAPAAPATPVVKPAAASTGKSGVKSPLPDVYKRQKEIYVIMKNGIVSIVTL